MASFSRISKRLANRQAMEQRMGEYMLGRDVEGERQDIREGRSQYASDVAEYERASMRARGRKGKRQLLGTLLGIGLNFIPGIGPMAAIAGAGASKGAILGSMLAKAAPGMIGGALGGYSSSRVDMPSYQSNVYVEPGKFQKGARTDLSRDISDTMRFIESSNQGQGLLDWTSAINSGLLIQQFGGLFGDDEDGLFSGYGRGNQNGGSYPAASFRDLANQPHQTGRGSSTGYGGY